MSLRNEFGINTWTLTILVTKVMQAMRILTKMVTVVMMRSRTTATR